MFQGLYLVHRCSPGRSRCSLFAERMTGGAGCRLCGALGPLPSPPRPRVVQGGWREGMRTSGASGEWSGR